MYRDKRHIWSKEPMKLLLLDMLMEDINTTVLLEVSRMKWLHHHHSQVMALIAVCIVVEVQTHLLK
jgi:hypothetical protein